MHGQERSFRIKKWVLILAILGYIYMDSGWQGVRLFVVCAFFFGIVVHFLFRYKTHEWTKPWWIMKKVIKTPFD